MTGIALVTGAGSGIGRATARALIGAGWRVALLGRRAGPLEETAEGSGSLILTADVADPAQVDAAFAKLAAEWGRLDLMFNNAGLSLPGKPIDEIAVEDWQRLSRTNIDGMFYCARAAFGLMRRQDPQGGRIINNGSVSAHVPRPGTVPYTMSKHAVTGLTRTLGLDGRRFNIACTQIDIGNALTALGEKFQKGVPQADLSVKVEPVMDVAHVAGMVLHIAGLPLEVGVPFVTVMARDMPFLGRG